MNIFPLLETLAIIVPILLAVAFITIIERKVLASIQRRVGPNIVGIFGILQPFADALKLVVKETVVPSHSNTVLFYLAPIITMIFSLLGWAVIPIGPGLAISDIDLGVLFTLAISSVGVYGVLLAGWSANSKYPFLGGLRSCSQIISYELVLGSAILCVLFLSNSFNYTVLIESQSAVWYIWPLFPVFVLFIISLLAETNRTPFDLPEAESELVSGFITEHSSIVFVLFFLGEYCSIVLISAVSATLFLGGWAIPEIVDNNTIISIASIILGLKTCLGCFGFVWVRATLPRITFPSLIIFCWTGALPLAIACVLLVPSIIITFEITTILLYLFLTI